jgi:hypothetical protein
MVSPLGVESQTGASPVTLRGLSRRFQEPERSRGRQANHLVFRNQNNRIAEVRGSTEGPSSEQSKGHAKRSIRSEQVNARFRIGSEEKIQRPAVRQTVHGGAKAVLTARDLPDSPVVRQLLEWVAELEKRPAKK